MKAPDPHSHSVSLAARPLPENVDKRKNPISRIVQVRLLFNCGRAGLYRSRQWATQAFKSSSHPGRSLTVLHIGALSDLDNVTIRIADIAACLAVLGDRLSDEFGASTFP